MEFRKLRRHGAARVAAWTMTVAMAGWVPGTGIALAAGPEMAGISPALTVASNPIGAAVYVDGKAVGETPLKLKVAAGDHRVKVVKDGYLENSRVVSVVSGHASQVDINLTPHQGRTAARMQVEPGGSYNEGGGGNGKKIALIAVGVAAVGAGVYLLTRSSNDPPTVGAVTSTPRTGLASVTNIAFSVSATDPDGDVLSYAWDFGDGLTGTGQAPSHIYGSAGNYSVKVTVSDGKESVIGNGSVNIVTLSGVWTGTVRGSSGGAGSAIRTTLNQNGANLTGTFSYQGLSGPARGSISGQNVSLTFTPPSPYLPFSVAGRLSSDFNTIEGPTSGLRGPATLTISR
jgi:hypothetical protein